MLAMLGGCGRMGFDRTEGGATDGATTTDAPPSLCAQSTALICDGFDDSGSSLHPRWELDNDHGRAVIDGSRAYRGTSSLSATTEPITMPVLYPRGSVLTYDGMPLVGTIYLRVFVYLPALPSASFLQLVNFSNTAGVGISMGTRNGYVTNNDYTSMLYAESTTVRFPTDRWTCLQFEMPSGTSGASRIAIDGVDVADVTLTKAAVQPAPDHVYIGVDWPDPYTNLGPSSAWFDELIVDDAPTTCAQ
jgi:hypothetical protein